MTAERQLWASVLLLAVSDLTSPGRMHSPERRAAESWVGTYPSKDFREVATLAGLDPHAAHSRVRKLMDDPVSLRRKVA